MEATISANSLSVSPSVPSSVVFVMSSVESVAISAKTCVGLVGGLVGSLVGEEVGSVVTVTLSALSVSSPVKMNPATSGLVGGLVGTLVGEEVGSSVAVAFPFALSSVSPPTEKPANEKDSSVSSVLSSVPPPMLSNESPAAAVSSELVGTLVGCE